MASTSELPFTPPPVNTPSLDLNLAVLPSDTTSDADDLDDDMDSVGMGTPHEVDEPSVTKIPKKQRIPCRICGPALPPKWAWKWAWTQPRWA
ncbi:MAG: hypothetical protein R2857_15160 [Vampirovibrionales bacterium]